MAPHDSHNPLTRPMTAPDLPPLPTLSGFQMQPWDPALAAQQAAAPPSPANAPPTMNALLQALRRRWLLAATLSLLAGLLGTAAVWLLMPPKYMATTILKLSSVRNQQLFGGDPEGIEFNVWKNTQPAVLKSPLVIKAALDMPGVRDLGILRARPDPVGWLGASLKTDFLLGPEVLRVTLAGDDPQEVARVLNAIKDAYLKDLQDKERVKRKRTLEQLDDIYKAQARELRTKRQNLAALQGFHKIEDEQVASDRYRDAQNALLQIEKDGRELEFKALKLKSEINSLKKDSENLSSRPIPDAVIDAYLKDDPAFTQFAKDLGGIDAEISQVATAAKDPHRRLKALQRLREGVLTAIVQYRKKQRPRVEEQIRLSYELQVEQKQSELGVAEEAQRLQKAEVARWEKKVKDLDPNSRPRARQIGELQDAKDKVQQTEKFMDNVSLEKAKLEAQPEPEPRVTPLADAEAPSERDTGRQLKLGTAAGIGLFGLALFGVAFVEFRSRKIGSAQDVAQGLGMRVLGTLPALPARARLRPAGAAGAKDLYWQGLLTEAVDAVRTQILHQARTDGLSVVMVTSAVGGEGKTSLASQLAASLARAWKNTLLIDGDLRNPAAHTLFDLPPEPGLCEALRGEVDLADVVKPTPQSRLWMVPAGHWDSHAVQALAQDGVRGLFDELKKQFDFIIVDSCPVLPVADALALAQHVDAVIYAVLRDVSRSPAVHAAQQRLAALGVRSLGAVVLGATDNPHHASYQYTKGAR